MDSDLQWTIGIAVTITLFFGTTMVGAFWKIVAMVKKVEESMEDSSKELHARINRVREDTVHKSDLEGHLTRLGTEMRDMRQEQRDATKSTNERLDKLIDAMADRRRAGGD